MSTTEESAGAVAVREEGQEVERKLLPPPMDNGVMHPDRWTMFTRIAKTVAKTDFVPKGIRGNEAAVMACLLFGDSLGLHPSVSLTEVYVIDGRPSISAALMAGKVRQAGHQLRREEIIDGGKVVGVTAHGRRADGEVDSFTFTLDMATRAGLMGKDNWKKYPEAMLWARACSQLSRMLFSDVFQGQATYTPDELEELRAVNGGDPSARGEAAGEADYGEDPELEAALRAHFDALDYLHAKRTLLLEGKDDAGRRDLLTELEREAAEAHLKVEVPEPETADAAEVVAESEEEPAVLSPEAEAEADRLWQETKKD